MSTTPQTQSNSRQANYELLRIYAILLISLMHGISSAYASVNLVNSIAHVSINAIGNMGVTIFVLVSGYFGIRLRVSKIIWLWSLMFFYSLVIFAIQCYTSEIPLPDNYENAKEFLKNLYTAITPVTSNRWWFCSSYFILMMLAPLLSKACNNISKQSFQYLLGVLLFFYSISPTFLMHSLTYTLGGKCTETIILAYLIGRYIARFGYPACIQQHYRTIFIGCFSVIFVVDFFVMDPLFMAETTTCSLS